MSYSRCLSLKRKRWWQWAWTCWVEWDKVRKKTLGNQARPTSTCANSGTSFLLLFPHSPCSTLRNAACAVTVTLSKGVGHKTTRTPPWTGRRFHFRHAISSLTVRPSIQLNTTRNSDRSNRRDSDRCPLPPDRPHPLRRRIRHAPTPRSGGDGHHHA